MFFELDVEYFEVVIDFWMKSYTKSKGFENQIYFITSFLLCTVRASDGGNTHIL